MSVSWDGRVHFLAPRIDTSCHTLRFFEAGTAERVDDVQTANAMVTVDDDSLVTMRFDFVQSLAELAHRNQHRAGNCGGLVFFLFATIKQEEVLVGLN